MALSTTSTISIPCRPSPSPSSSSFPLNTALAFPTKPRRSILIASSSGDNPTETNTATTTTTTGSDTSESSIEAPDLPPSLISALNVERALRGIAITDVDHYGRLGLPRKCPYDQVAGAYKRKVEEVKSEGLEEDELNEKLEQLKESYRILSSVEERRLYDWSLARSSKPDRYMWPFEADITQTPTQSPPPPEPEDEGPTRLVGYFMLGWVLLSFALSIALNR
ncbi:NAD(P)H-quinone oxidoreductase subunit U, chloroplastic [Rhodamnia argentea]|uniref:NAD(P)H-quinone oxidoreductase subunit U, chloroplastic n=1 Tax=Rhodamnia argentea TaxID=178133 RepID=A0A8B8PUQ5_9MYRT|nr:NAD(P)H-quinone oxidoreductase subunit U, chloroplastic [Rhodamnia argentea]